MTLREKAIEAGSAAIVEYRRRFQRKWVKIGMSHAALPEPPTELVARAAFDAFVASIMEPDEAMIKAGKSVTAVEASTGRDMYLDTVSVVEAYKSMIRKLMGDRG